MLSAQSPMRGLNSQTLRSWPELKPRVRCLTDWATQAPLFDLFLILLFFCFLTHWFILIHFFLNRCTQDATLPLYTSVYILYKRKSMIKIRKLTLICYLIYRPYSDLSIVPIMSFIAKENFGSFWIHLSCFFRLLLLFIWTYFLSFFFLFHDTDVFKE